MRSMLNNELGWGEETDESIKLTAKPAQPYL